jgi:HTH-type transcriptional repressor of puuD
MEAKKALQINVSTLRKKFKLSQTELAERAGISQKLVSELENGKGWPEHKSIQGLAKAFGVEESDLYTDPEMIKSLEYLIKRNLRD